MSGEMVGTTGLGLAIRVARNLAIPTGRLIEAR
jgi:hypothetical protein